MVKHAVRILRKDKVVQRYWKGNIEKLTEKNNYFRKVIFTGKKEQLVLMTIPVGGEIGNEIHRGTDQFFRIEVGTAKFRVKNKTDFTLGPGGGVVIQKGTWHNVINAGNKPLKLYTLYAPPHHPDGTIDKTRMDAILREQRMKHKSKKVRCMKCKYATFKRFGVYCEYEGVPITSDEDLKAYCPYERGGEFGK